MASITINTTDSKRIEITVKTKDKEDRIIEDVKDKSSQKALLLIDYLLRQNNIELSEIEEVRVNSGPGSFTGIKVGVAIANALGFALGVPVNGKASAKPKYE